MTTGANHTRIEFKWSKSHLRREASQIVLLVKMSDCSRVGPPFIEGTLCNLVRVAI